MAKTVETVMKKTTEKHKKQVMDGEKDGEQKPDEVKAGKKTKRPKATHLKTSELVKRNSGEMMEGVTEKSRTGEQKEGERKKEKGRDVSGDGEKRARTGSGDESGQDVEESRVIKKSRGHEDSKQNVKVWTVSYSSTVDVIGGDKNIKPGTHRRERDEVEKCGAVQTLSTHRETDRKRSREARDQGEESSDADQCVSWVQCSDPGCGKWRRLSDGVDPSVLPDDWTCKNNTDPTFSSCSAPEEKSSVPEEEVFFYSLVPGSLVWARQSGYPWWPAMVERDPNTEEYLEFRTESDLTPFKCHVTYFGEPVTRAWVVCSRVRDYADLSEDQLLNKVNKDLKDAIYMAKEALKLSLKERLVKFGFRSRYVSDRESSEDSDITEMLELFCGNDCSDEDSWSKKQRSGRKQKERKREGKRSGRGKEGKQTERVGDGESEKNRRVVKKPKEGKAVVINGVPAKGGKEKCVTPSFSLPKKKKQHRADPADQTVPQSSMETSTDMTLDPDMHSEGEGMERRRERAQCGPEEKERRGGEGREDEDDDEGYKDAPDREEEEDEEEQDRFSLWLMEEE